MRLRSLSPRTEVWLLVALGVLFLAVNLPTLSRSPIVWLDEVEFVDPAAHLVDGEGYRSTAWLRQKRDAPFVAQVPAYPLLMAGWVRFTGVTPTGTRSLNVALMLGVAVLLWVALRRLRPLESPWLRLGAVALVLSGAGLVYAYRGARYDPLAMLLALGIVVAATAPSRVWRLGGVAGLAALAPWTALPLLPYFAVAGGLVVLLSRARALREAAVAAWGGVLAGCVALWAVFSALDLWAPFLKCVNINASLTRGGVPELPAEHVAAVIHDYPSHLVADPSVGVLLLGITALLSIQGLRQRVGLGSWPAAATLLALVLPLVLALAGKYDLYYSWMVFVPLVVAAGVLAERWEGPGRRAARAVLAAVAIAAFAVGLPARLAVTVAQWELRDPAALDELAGRHVTDNDWVYCDWEGYYAARAHGDEVFLSPYLYQLRDEEKARIAVLLIRPENLSEVRFWLGGDWVLQEQRNPIPRASGLLRWRADKVAHAYGLAVYRRADAAGSVPAQ